MNNASNNPDNSNPAKVVIEFEENRWGEVYNSHIKVSNMDMLGSQSDGFFLKVRI